MAFSYKRTESKVVFNVEGQFGQLEIPLSAEIYLTENNRIITIASKNKKLHGVSHTLIVNALVGVSQGFQQNLNVIGVGYKVSLDEGKALRFKIGLSHDVIFTLPLGIIAICPKPDYIVLFGIKKDFLFKVVSRIQNLKRPDIYKGKGIRFENEVLRLKEGKKK